MRTSVVLLPLLLGSLAVGCGDDASSGGNDGSGEDADVRDDAGGSGQEDASGRDDTGESDAASGDTGADAEEDTGEDAASGEVPFGHFGGCTIGLGATSIVLLGQSPTRLYTIAGLTCELTVADATYEDAPVDLEADNLNAYVSTESQLLATALADLGETATLEQPRAVMAHGFGLLYSASESGPVLGLSADLNELARSEDTEFIELIGCIDIESNGAPLYGLCGWNANGETYAGVLAFDGNPLQPSILFTAAPGNLPRSIALVGSTVYLLEATQPAVYTIAPDAEPVATDLSATFPVSDGFSSLSGEIFAVDGDVWLTTIGDERGQIYSLSQGTFSRTGDEGAGIPDLDILDVAQVGFSPYAVAVTPWVEDLDDGRRVEGTQVLEITTGNRQVVGRAIFNGIFPAFVR